MGKFLDIDPENAESIIGDMISQNRILAQLDQMTNSIDFHVEIGSKAVQVAGTTVMGAPSEAEEDLAKDKSISEADRKQHDINESIHSVCQNIDSLIQDILKEHPDL